MSRTPCVVVASESSDGRQNIAGMLSEEHWHVVGAADGETAVELVHARTADLLLIDTHLRDRSGLDVCRRLRHEVESRLFPIVVISNQDDISSRVAALEAGADDFLSRPIERNELIARVRSLLHLKSIHERLEDTRQVIFALANAAEAKDLFTQEHTERVADSASDLARRLNLGAATIEQIRTGALIHDVGKLAVPDHILNKPGPLTDSEFALVRTHTLVGAEIVAPLTSQRDLVAIVRNHHERFDGGGYPDRLRGEAIPLAARIVAVCDAFDAMTNQRPYRPAMPYPRALSILKAGRGRQWDTALVDAFVTILEQR